MSGMDELQVGAGTPEQDRRTEHDRRASTHEPPPTGEGAIVLDFAVARTAQLAKVALRHGDPSVANGFDLVRAALVARAEFGKAKYGTYLRTENGRDALVDIYQELLDAIMYGEQCNYEAGIVHPGEQYPRPDVQTRLLVGAGCLNELYRLAARVASEIAKAA